MTMTTTTIPAPEDSVSTVECPVWCHAERLCDVGHHEPVLGGAYHLGRLFALEAGTHLSYRVSVQASQFFEPGATYPPFAAGIQLTVNHQELIEAEQTAHLTPDDARRLIALLQEVLGELTPR